MNLPKSVARQMLKLKPKGFDMTPEELSECIHKAAGPIQRAASYWSIEDVDTVLEEQELPEDRLTPAQKSSVLHRIDYNYDAAIGINWDVLHVFVRRMLMEKP